MDFFVVLPLLNIKCNGTVKSCFKREIIKMRKYSGNYSNNVIVFDAIRFCLGLNSFNKTEAAVFSCRQCFLRAFPFISLIIMLLC